MNAKSTNRSYGCGTRAAEKSVELEATVVIVPNDADDDRRSIQQGIADMKMRRVVTLEEVNARIEGTRQGSEKFAGGQGLQADTTGSDS